MLSFNNNEKVNEAHLFMLKLEKEPVHALHVAKLSLQMFDQLKPLHQLGDEARILLECASYLHDIGLALSTKQHHKHSMGLILDFQFTKIDQRGQVIIANIARYHRCALPKPKHHEFVRLNEQDRDIVRKVAPFLRIADGLDKTHNQRIDKLECLSFEQCAQFKIHSDDPCIEERESVEKKKNFFVETYRINYLLTDSLIYAEDSINSSIDSHSDLLD